jgi:hypothetical protein
MPLITACLWDRYFVLSWDEEVQLHDGRVIIVKLRHTYEKVRLLSTREERLDQCIRS